MTRRFAVAVLMVLLIALLAAGCGSSKSDNSAASTSASSATSTPTESTTTEETDTNAGTETDADSGDKTPCKKPAAKKGNGLPATFPVPGELTITSVTKLGPTDVVEGYWTSELDEAYRELKAQVLAAHYKVLFTENEHRDAEISYQGSGHTGQIALRADCTEDATTRVHITNRPL
jgi:hypothetical protein